MLGAITSASRRFRGWQREISLMTLVFAQKKGNVTAIVSDTGITKFTKRLSPERCTPKICILTPDLAVAFAGDPDLAKRSINSLPANANYKAITDHFLKCHHEADHQVDFLILLSGRTQKILRVRGGNISDPLSSAWIGDKAAFEVFQRYRNSGPSATVTSVFENPALFSTYDLDDTTSQIVDALHYVIMDSSVESVFGFCVAVNNSNGGFKYIDYALALTEREFSIAFTEEFLQEIAPERDELRKYALSCLVTDGTARMVGLAFHVFHAKLTYVYLGESGKPLEYSRKMVGRNIEEFRQDTY